ncbi:hypothetical protein XELAEV_18047033mg [Xenopus laevis]|uniref:Uncharacterized protein n=1 Tax=Xenopus laevis TaxID=8355 RepID=A0A974H164_XENLA|nr:hypothetical protein XELAEV_18047033mg [Xenopus laevis]
MAGCGTVETGEVAGLCASETLEDRVHRFNRYEIMLGDMEVDDDGTNMVFNLFKTLEKQMSYELLTCWDILTIEKGLRLRKYPTFARGNQDFANKWNDALSKCSMELMGFIIDYKRQKLSNIRDGIKELQIHLTALEKSPDFDRLDTKLQEHLPKLETSVSTRKKRTLKRDKRDYDNEMVYLWNKPKSCLRKKQNKYNHNKSVSFSSTSSDSGEETSFCTEDVEPTSFRTTRSNPTELDLEDFDSSEIPRKAKNYHGKDMFAKHKKTDKKDWPRRNYQAERRQEEEEEDFGGGHYRLFNTLLDVNKFVRKLTLRRHFGSCGIGTDSDNSQQVEADSVLTGVNQKGSPNFNSFREYCCLTDLSSLQRESTTESQSQKNTIGHILLSKKMPSSFYPLQSRCPSMDTFQDLVEGDLTKLSLDRPRRTLER